MKNIIKIKNLTDILRLCHPPTYVIKKEKLEDGVDGRLVAYSDPQSYLAEQYKILRTSLYSLLPENPPKTLLITSAQAKEGKTITCCNLAYTLAMDKSKKVLLVDADLRRPEVHKILNIKREPGFSDVLEKKANVEDLVKKPAVDNLFVLTVGSIADVSPSEMLLSANIKAVVDKLRSSFDYVIFDTPPVLNVTDACILGSICDAVILVVKAGATQKKIIQDAYNMLAEAHAKPTACVLTHVRLLLDSYHYYGKYKHYYPSTDQAKVKS